MLQVGNEYNSFDELNDAIRDYSEQHSVLFVKDDCKKVASENAKLGPNTTKYPDRFVYRFVRFRCKHGGDVRTNGRGTRPNQRSFKTECPSELSVSANRKKDKMVVLKFVDEHNHEISR
ncbi:PREDICTED: uncharacterized protein LOC106816920 [Priapulus caudatus]|uniref:Uncharacterized protein LOC106816920 n=1 Tax=Priapulus caudatus TaxID=37621 RepID=A0ABM1EXX7_PRICU|nr:PREDICTED: uncharacterized protein LOC106816920 [Priapulus caudatus]